MFKRPEDKPIPLNCLTDCNAACCRKLPTMRIAFDLSETEVAMFTRKGVKLKPAPGGGWLMPGDCVFLSGNLCTLHNKPEQPNCCQVNKVGGSLCLEVRDEVRGARRRHSDVE